MLLKLINYAEFGFALFLMFLLILIVAGAWKP